MEKQNLPKLNNISYNKDTRLRLVKGKPYIGKNGQGEYRMWTFTDLEDNETKVFFAPEDSHALLQKLGEGSELILRKVPLQDGSKISPKFELTVVNAVARNGNGHDGKGDDFKRLLTDTIKEVVQVVNESGVQFSNDSLQKLISTVFIQRTKVGL